MFNILKEMYLEVNGYDMEKIKEERIQKEEQKKANKIVLSKFSKHILRGFGILYLLIGIICLTTFFSNGDWLGVVKYAFMLLLDVVAMILVSIKSKDAEVAGIICSAVFVILNMILPLF